MRFPRPRHKPTMLLPLTEVFSYLAAGTLAMFPVVMVFYEAEKLSFWGWVLIVIYMTILISIVAVLKYIRERRYLKALLEEKSITYFSRKKSCGKNGSAGGRSGFPAKKKIPGKIRKRIPGTGRNSCNSRDSNPSAAQRGGIFSYRHRKRPRLQRCMYSASVHLP